MQRRHHWRDAGRYAQGLQGMAAQVGNLAEQRFPVIHGMVAGRCRATIHLMIG
ncbi:MAG: hypothetical protein NWQ08_05295 [Porticoccaceae bacterium]|nr:hypothetical protein [Porticoccaceae bacterium]